MPIRQAGGRQDEEELFLTDVGYGAVYNYLGASLGYVVDLAGALPRTVDGHQARLQRVARILPAYLVLGFHSLPARLASERGHISHLFSTLRERAGAVGKKMQTLLAATSAPMTLIAAADCR